MIQAVPLSGFFHKEITLGDGSGKALGKSMFDEALLRILKFGNNFNIQPVGAGINCAIFIQYYPVLKMMFQG